jgi:GTP-binding protein
VRNLPVEFVSSHRDIPPPSELPEVAFAGRSNVGKSSALNCLWNRKSLARVSRTPGRTQHINLFRLGDFALFADLPGYGYAEVPDAVRADWKPMVENYLSERSNLKLVVVLIDVRRNVQESDGALLYALTEARIPSLPVATKADKLGRQQLSRQLAALRSGYHLPPGLPIAFSSIPAKDGTRQGRDQVWDAIEAACGWPPPTP